MLVAQDNKFAKISSVVIVKTLDFTLLAILKRQIVGFRQRVHL